MLAVLLVVRQSGRILLSFLGRGVLLLVVLTIVLLVFFATSRSVTGHFCVFQFPEPLFGTRHVHGNFIPMSSCTKHKSNLL